MNTHNEMSKDTVEDYLNKFEETFKYSWNYKLNEPELKKWITEALTTVYNKGVEVGRELAFEDAIKIVLETIT